MWRFAYARDVFTLASDADLLRAFRPKDRAGLELDPALRFPLEVRDYLAWRHPAGGRVYLVFTAPGGVPTGIAFDANHSGEHAVMMCDWCHSFASGTHVGLLTATLNGTKRIGVHLCSDLSCKAKLEEQANLAGRPVEPLVAAVVSRMGRFASEGLHIDLSGANR